MPERGALSRPGRPVLRCPVLLRHLALIFVVAGPAAGSDGRLVDGSGGSVLPGAAVDPVFLSDLETAGLCEWSNILDACDDANLCTDDLCDGADGSCSHENNTDGCALPNATGICDAGGCTIASCNAGRSSCDDDDLNGCEVNHNESPNVCGSALNVGNYAADEACGFICDDNLSWTQFALQTNRTERWFKARALENSTTCTAALAHRIVLAVPPGVDYDLYVYSDCAGTLLGSSTSSSTSGSSETVTVSRSDDIGDTSFDYWVEVRWKSGASCTNYSLAFEGHAPCG